MIHVMCNGCHAFALTENGADPDSALACACCPEDHSHSANANAGNVCRPVTITMLPGAASLQAGT